MIERPKQLTDAEFELVELYKSLTTWDQPFLAGQGNRYACSDPKILIVGKATGGWSGITDPFNPADVRKKSDEFINGSGELSAFWRYIDRLGPEFSTAWKEPIKHVAWTNIARIGYLRGNPEGQQFKKQENVCKKLLHTEISYLQPDLIILVTHNYQHQFVEEFFKGIEWQNLSDNHSYAWSGIWENRIAVVWTRHPQAKAEDELRSERRAIRDFFFEWRTNHVTSK